MASRQCLNCMGEHNGTGVNCDACASAHRIRGRNRYRIKRGIPLDKPLDRRGRPRKHQQGDTNASLG
jgi:hypothetical protein